MSDPSTFVFPDTFETERLLIRAPRTGDGTELHAAISESLPELRLWMPWAHEPLSPESCEDNTLRACADFVARRDLRLQLYLRSAPDILVGSSGLHRIDWDVPRFEIGYWPRTRFAGQGFATEAVRGVAAFAFRELAAQRVEIWCDERNVRSAAVARRVGFRHEGTLRDRRLGVFGELTTELVLGLVRDEAQEALGDSSTRPDQQASDRLIRGSPTNAPCQWTSRSTRANTSSGLSPDSRSDAASNTRNQRVT